MISSSPCPVPDTAFAIDTMVIQAYDTPKVRISGPPDFATCEGNPISLLANPTAGGSWPAYQWMLNGSPVGSGTNTYSYMPETGDKVSCVMTSSYHCPVPYDTASDRVTVHVDSVIIVSVTDAAGGLVAIGASDTFVAHVEFAGISPSYQWYKNGIIIPGATNFKLYGSDYSNGDSISCMVTTGAGSACEGLRGYNWKMLLVAPAGVAAISHAIDQLQLIPNPNAGNFSISGHVAGSETLLQLRITDLLGQTIWSGTANIYGNKFETSIDLENKLAAGLYYLHIVGASAMTTMNFMVSK
jgi:hypothetical protein